MPLGGSHEHEGKIRLAKLPSPLRMVDLTFTYPTRPSYTVLRSLNLTIPLGTSVAIIGSSGSGKSTIASLLMKLYTPSQTDDSSIASISFGSYSISDLRTDFLRSSIAYIPQNVTIFPTTITQNITYGLSPSSAYCKPEEVTAAAKLAGLHSFITSLPSSYNTLIGEGGTTLSGGQVQRIGIARALVRGPQAVIMDEPTSNLDTGSARRVRNVVKRLVSIGVTVIAITHDKEMMKVCGRVVVLKDGKVVKDGKPDATD